MDWAKKEVPSVELSKKLKELGFPQKEPGWFWCLRKDSEFYDLFFTMDKMYFYKPKQYEEFFIFEYHHLQDYIKAPTCPEMDKWLPLYLKKDAEKGTAFNVEVYGLHLYRTYDNKGWCITYGTLGRCAFTLPNAFAEMLICLVENRYITFNQGDESNAQSRQQT